MRRFVPSRSSLVLAWLAAAGLAACSSDDVARGSGDGGPTPSDGATSMTGGAGGTTGSTGGGSGASAAGGRADGGTAGARAGAGGRAGASGGASSGGRGGQSTGGVGGAGGGCTYGSVRHPVGSTFLATDGCNTCSCSASGAVSCTKRACVSDAGADSSVPCTDTPAAKVCVRGPTVTSAGESLKVGDKLTVQVVPRGCFSSSCTAVQVATCSLSGTMPATVDARFCLASTASAGGGCTADCSGGGSATCEGPALTAGEHTVRLGGLSVTFSVPGLLPLGGECIGSPF